MHRMTQDHAPQNDTPFPWEVAHAAPEDQAVGLELQLIELVARRRAVRDGAGPEAVILDAEIEVVLTELGDLTSALPIAV